MRKSYSLVLMISFLFILAYTNIAAADDIYIYSTGTIGTTPGNTLFLDDPTYPDDVNLMKNDVLNNTYPASTWGYANDETYNKIAVDANLDNSYTTQQMLNGQTAHVVEPTSETPVPGYSGLWHSGWYKVTFTLPTNFTNATLTLYASADDLAYAFLNNNLLNPLMYITEYNTTPITDTIQGNFTAGTNTLLFAVSNSGAGPTGLSFAADINYDVPNPGAPVPEPATMLLLGSGLVGLAGFRYRFIKK